MKKKNIKEKITFLELHWISHNVSIWVYNK